MSAEARARLSPTQIQTCLRDLTGWALDADAGALHKSWTFASFDDAVQGFNRIATLAKAQDHHPDVRSSFTRLQVRLWTHDVAGLTELDFKLAHSIDQQLADIS